MTDIFGRAGDAFGGAMSADGAQINFTEGSAGLLSQNLQIQYQQEIRRIWELESNKTYFVAGRSSGTLSIARIIGPKPLSSAFFTRFGNVCNAGDNIINFSGVAGCGTSAQARYSMTCRHVVLQGLSWAITMGDMIMNQNLQGMFTSLSSSES
jgi:hypothetical protein